MMNLVQLQEKLRDFSPQQLATEMQAPTGNVPQYLVLGELQRRKRMEASAMQGQAQESQTTVAQDAVTAAGVPQQGLAGMMQAMAPQTDAARNTGQAPVQQMAGGGLAGVSRNARDYDVLSDPALMVQARRMGMTPDEYLASLDPQAQRQNRSRVERNRMLAMEPRGDGMAFPSQEDLDQRYQEQQFLDAFGAPPRGLDAPRMDSSPSLPMLNDVPTSLSNPEPLSRPAPPAPVPSAPRAFTSTQSVPAMDPTDSVSAVMRTLQEQYPGSGYDDVFGLSRPAPPAPPAPVPSAPADPNAVPYESLEGILFPNRSLEDIRAGETPIADRQAAPDPFQEVFSMTGEESPVMTAPVDMEAEARRSAEEAAALRDGAGITESLRTQGDQAAAANAALETVLGTVEGRPDTPEAPEAPQADRSNPGGSGAAVMSDLEKSLEQDKWLSLAKFGMALMSSQQPTFGGAFGEAGLAATSDFQAAKQRYEDAKLARATLAARRAGGSGSAARMPAGAVNMFDDQIDALRGELAMADPNRQLEITRELSRLTELQQAMQIRYISQYDPALAGAMVESYRTGAGSGSGATDVADENASNSTWWNPFD